jgi:hypothetical protein
MRTLLALSIAWLACPAGAETAELDVFVQEAEPLDWLLIRNVEGCGAVSGELVVDFGGSVGRW